MRNTREDTGSGRPNGCVTKTKYDESCTSFSPFPLSPIPPLTILNPVQQPPPTSLPPQRNYHSETQTPPGQHTANTQRRHCDPTKTTRNSPTQQDEPSGGERWETTASGMPGQRPKPTDDESNSTKGNHPAVTKERRQRQRQPGR